MRLPCYSCSGRDCASCISPALLVRSALARHALQPRRRSAVPPRLSPAMLMLPHVAMPHPFASQVGPIRHTASIALDFHPRARPQLALAAASRLCRRLWLRHAAAVTRRVTLIAMVLLPARARFTLYSAPPPCAVPVQACTHALSCASYPWPPPPAAAAARCLCERPLHVPLLWCVSRASATPRPLSRVICVLVLVALATCGSHLA